MPDPVSTSARPSRPMRPSLGLLARRIPAALLVAHGSAHLVGAVEAFAASADGESVLYLFERWELSGASTLRSLGAAWLLVACGYTGVAIAEWANQRGWRGWLTLVTAVSLVLAVAALPASVWGVAIDVGILVWLAGDYARRTGEHES